MLACVLSFEKRNKDLCCHLLAVFSRVVEIQVSCKLLAVVHCVELGAGKKEHQHEVLACRLRVGCNSAMLLISHYIIHIIPDSSVRIATKQRAGRPRIRGSIPSRRVSSP
jgi:hypothetical protein